MSSRANGFTLIEVLIALAILAIALTAIIKSTGLTIRETHYIQEKTIAAWVATNVIHQVQARIIKLPSDPGALNDETTMLNQTWQWEGQLINTPDKTTKEIQVTVFNHDKKNKLITMTGYLYG